MKALRSWIPAALAAVLAACGDGGIQSPDFTPVVSITNLRIQPLDPQQGTQIPVGTTLPFQAIATFEQTVPPGTEGAQNGVVVRDEDVTGIADWQSQNSGFATVDSGIVRGVSPSGGQVRITAAYEGLVAQTFVTVTEAVLVGVDHVRPRAATARDPADRYTAAAGSAVPFEIFGEFSDGAIRQLDEGSFDVSWTSSDTTVADNPADDETFNTLTVGTTQIRGTVTNAQGIDPAFATAQLVVEPLNAFCESEFVAPPSVFSDAASDLCLACDVEQPAAIFDANIETFGTMSIPLGLLLQSSVSVTVSQTPTNPLSVGRPAGFLVSRSDSLLSAELLSDVTIETVACDVGGGNCAVRETFGVGSTPLYLALLGLIGGEDVSLLSTGPLGDASADANGLRLTFSGGLVSALATLNVHSSCAVARDAEEEAPAP
ncbi:hypothetical protein [Sinimarinibacterium flocculans]|uniref:Ig-like protein group 2 n=1 Tax=Sinimarinibacterium flocculans TaxID=985250 RepID=A0A318E949_9GAMM|nr:hypothetical protein [Sinimarinibacterium flocculans]PXV68547.1 hypothetical protein C8D93_104245 [Sinimarinibacterium flocculans]